jgi:homoaconitase/3-isopropylmalate dehydratase large subunit/3-isopropylmalate dehydratase small subunit
VSRIERWLGAPAGAEVARAVDLIVTDDWTTPALEAPLGELGTRRVGAPVVLVHDHTGPPGAYEGADRARVEALRARRDAFARRFGVEVIDGLGIQHHVLHELGRVRPGMLVLGNDSHAPTLGAYGAIAIAAQPTTIAAAMHTGRIVLRVPATVRVRLEGCLGSGVTARDAALELRRRMGARAGGPRATGRALEFGGPGVASLSTAERAVIANVTPELAAVTATFPADGEPDDDPRGGPADLVLDLAAVRPTVAPAGGGEIASLASFPRTRVDRVFVGTCAGGTFEEIAAFAEALGARAAVPTIVAPASATIESRLRRAGLLASLEAAGVQLLPPGCGPCFGFGVGRLGDGEVAVTTGNRNGVGRMGSPTSRVHLAAGATAGEAARSGWLGTDAAPSARPGAGAARASVSWPRRGNVVRLVGTVTTDDLTPSFVPGIGASSDTDPAVLRRLLLAHVAPEAAERDLRGAVIVAGHDFGIGSNRASAVRALRLAGVAAVVARSASPLYAAGARDEGLILVELDDDDFHAAAGPDAVVDVDLDAGRVIVDGRAFPVPAATPYERAVRAAGGVVAFLRALG